MKPKEYRMPYMDIRKKELVKVLGNIHRYVSL
jgi:hypothetical protein